MKTPKKQQKQQQAAPPEKPNLVPVPEPFAPSIEDLKLQLEGLIMYPLQITVFFGNVEKHFGEALAFFQTVQNPDLVDRVLKLRSTAERLRAQIKAAEAKLQQETKAITPAPPVIPPEVKSAALAKVKMVSRKRHKK